jgi:hypothetical protein
METVSYRELIGENLRRLRGDRLTQEDVADIARRHGLPWRQSTVQAIEKGRRDFSIGELALLQDIFPPLELVQQDPQDGRYVDWPGVGALDPVTFKNQMSKLFIERRAAGIAVGALRQQRADSIGNAAKRKVDGKVAKTLGVRPEEVSRAALNLWSHGFAEERDRRFGEAVKHSPKSEPMLKAWITRRMTKELEGKV